MGAHKRYFRYFWKQVKLVLANKYKHKLLVRKCFFFYKKCKKSCKRETKHLLTDADSSTDAIGIGGWTRIPQNPIFLKTEKSPKMQKLRNI